MMEFRIVPHTDGLRKGYAIQHKNKFLWFSWWEYTDASYAGGIIFRETKQECEEYIKQLKNWT